MAPGSESDDPKIKAHLAARGATLGPRYVINVLWSLSESPPPSMLGFG